MNKRKKNVGLSQDSCGGTRDLWTDCYFHTSLLEIAEIEVKMYFTYLFIYFVYRLSPSERTQQCTTKNTLCLKS